MASSPSTKRQPAPREGTIVGVLLDDRHGRDERERMGLAGITHTLADTAADATLPAVIAIPPAADTLQAAWHGEKSAASLIHS